MEPLLETLTLAEGELSDLRTAYSDNEAIIEGGDRDADGELLPPTDQSADWQTANTENTEVDNAGTIATAETAVTEAEAALTDLRATDLEDNRYLKEATAFETNRQLEESKQRVSNAEERLMEITTQLE